MIHQVAKLPYASRLLQDVLSLQVAVLEAAALPQVTNNMVSDPNAFTSVLEAYLESKRRFSGRGSTIANWVVNTKDGVRQALVKPLNQFANAPQADKEQFIADIKSDIYLLFRPKAATFQIAIDKSVPDWKKAAGDFLYTFYDLWQYGFPEFFFSSHKGKYSRQHFVQEFEKINSELFICAICDGSTYIARGKDHIYTSVDHFFPRSIYPHLSCHPLNLIPICSFCNSYIKGSGDPLELNGQRLPLIDLILPYQDLKTALSKSSFIAVARREPRKDKHLHPMQLELEPARSFTLGNRIAIFNNIYKIEERWNESLDEIEDHTIRRITQYLSLIDPVNQSIKPEALVQYLRALMAQTDMENIGKDPYAFPMIWLINSYIDQLEKPHRSVENAPIYLTLKKWAENNRKRWIQLEERSKEIQRRVP